MTQELFGDEERRAADLAATCTHLLSLDAIWTAHAARARRFPNERALAVEIGQQMTTELANVAENLPFADRKVAQLESALHESPPAVRESINQLLSSPYHDESPATVLRIAREAIGYMRESWEGEIDALQRQLRALSEGGQVSGDLSVRWRVGLTILVGAAMIAATVIVPLADIPLSAAAANALGLAGGASLCAGVAAWIILPQTR